MSISAGPLGDGPMNSSQGPTAVAHSWPYLIQQGVKLKFALVRVQITGPITGTGPKIRGRRNGTAYVGEAALELESGDVYKTTTVIEAITAFEADKTAFHGANVDNPPWNIDWQVARDGTTWEDAGTSSNPIYVCLENPKKGTGLPLNALDMFRTVVDLACKTMPGATSPSVAAENTWKLFSDNDSGPKNVRTWDLQPLHYYQPGTRAEFEVNGPPPFGNPTNVFLLLLIGTGQCTAWTRLLKDAWEINGVTSDFNEATSNATQFFWVKTWDVLGGSEFEFQSHVFDMYPYPSLDPYGYYGPGGTTLKNEPAIAGQGSGGDAAPSQKVFNFHQMLKLNGTYYDPSYGRIYTGADKVAAAAQFASVAVSGYGSFLFFVGPKSRLTFTTSGSIVFSD